MPFLWLSFVLYLAVNLQLVIPGAFAGIFNTSTRVLLVLSIACTFYSLVDLVDYKLGMFASRTASKVDDILLPMVGKTLRITVVALTVLQVAQDLSDKPLTSILAGLGVGGLAVALAGQETIKNLFGAVVIVGDKPFEIGDRVVIDGHDGPVESVGFRSTKVRTLDGHLVSVPNSAIVNTTVRNISRRPYIKHVANAIYL